MYRCNKCGGEIEELGDMASNNPCHCRIDALTSECARLRADLEKVTAERDELIKSVMRWIITNINTERASVEDVPVLYNAYCDCHTLPSPPEVKE